MSYHRPQNRKRRINNAPGEPLDAGVPALQQYSEHLMLGTPVRLDMDQARVLLDQFLETVRYRRWRMWAVSIMADHFHAVVGVVGDPEPGQIRRDLKSYGSCKLNQVWGEPVNGTWWTAGGSNRKLPNEASLHAAIQYTIDQPFPLLVWTHPIPELNLPGGLASRLR